VARGGDYVIMGGVGRFRQVSLSTVVQKTHGGQSAIIRVRKCFYSIEYN
jgi:hypothetical protein